MIKKTEIAWAAGFWDGEGCTYLSTRKNTIVLTITQNNRENLERFARAVGGGNVLGPYQAKGRERNQPHHQWRSEKYSFVIAVMTRLFPYLGEEKKNQFSSVLERDHRNGR